MAGVLAVLSAVPLAATASLLAVELGAECFVHSCDAIDRLAARGTAFLIVALMACALNAVHGARTLLRTGHPRAVVVSVATGVGFGELGWGWLGPSYSWRHDARGMAILATGVLPLLLLALPRARRWTRSMTRDDVHHHIGFSDKRLALWDGRLSEPTMASLSRANLWVLPMVYFALLMVPAPMMLGADYGASGGILGGIVIATLFGGSAVMHRRATGRARDQVAREHGLPTGSCRGVLFGDPGIFDATLRGAMRSAGVPPLPDAKPSSPLRQT